MLSKLATLYMRIWSNRRARCNIGPIDNWRIDFCAFSNKRTYYKTIWKNCDVILNNTRSINAVIFVYYNVFSNHCLRINKSRLFIYQNNVSLFDNFTSIFYSMKKQNFVSVLPIVIKILLKKRVNGENLVYFVKKI